MTRAALVGGCERHLVVLTHDVDWGRRGPPLDHLLARLSRLPLEERWRLLALRANVYDGIPDVLEAEERVYAKSTILFRPWFDDGSLVDDYADVASELARQGWEVGLHSNSPGSVDDVARQKAMVEHACGCSVVSHRAHYLRIPEGLIPRLAEAGLLVDSSVCYTRERPEPRTPGFEVRGNVLELPITVMDAYMFTYWRVSEDEVVPLVRRLILERSRLGVCVTTILWHVNSLRMYGGRVYPRLLEELYSVDNVVFVRMVDARGILLEGSTRNRG